MGVREGVRVAEILMVGVTDGEGLDDGVDVADTEGQAVYPDIKSISRRVLLVP